MTSKEAIILASLTAYVVALYFDEHSDDEPVKDMEEMPMFLPAAGATADIYRPSIQTYGLVENIAVPRAKAPGERERRH